MTDDQKLVIKETINKKLDEFKTKILAVNPNARVNFLIKEGKPYKQITKTAQELKCDTIVMGTNGNSGVENFIGSTTTRILSVAQRPVICVKEKHSNPTFNDIVVPIDLTKTSKQKLYWAARLGIIYDSTIHIIMEVQKDDFLKQKVDNNIAYAEQFLKENGVKYIVKLLDDESYPDNIGIDSVKYADEVDADLIMMMTQAEGNLSEFFMGSYAQQVVNTSQKVPVMSIRPKETEKTTGGGSGFYG
jgi:nucleotide-binding universal stress UspA family protein